VPKKTKKEKIIAELRRKLQSVEQGTETVKVVRPPEEKKIEVKITPQSTQNLANFDRSFIIHDLRKTFLLSGLAISLELVVYWIIELGGSKLLQFLPIKNF